MLASCLGDVMVLGPDLSASAVWRPANEGSHHDDASRRGMPLCLDLPYTRSGIAGGATCRAGQAPTTSRRVRARAQDHQGAALAARHEEMTGMCNTTGRLSSVFSGGSATVRFTTRARPRRGCRARARGPVRCGRRRARRPSPRCLPGWTGRSVHAPSTGLSHPCRSSW